MLKLYRVGPHLFGCGDLLCDWDRLYDAWDDRVDMIYSDPPWNAGNLGYWRTRAGFPKERQDWNRFIDCFAQCVAATEAEAVYVEQSIKNPNSMIDAAKCYGWPRFDTMWRVRYGAPIGVGDHMTVCKRPNLLLRFADHPWPGNPTNLAGEAMTAHVFDHEPLCNAKHVVADPCIGKGMTARMAHRYGMRCLGLELNPQRLAITLQWLERRGLQVIEC